MPPIRASDRESRSPGTSGPARRVAETRVVRLPSFVTGDVPAFGTITTSPTERDMAMARIDESKPFIPVRIAIMTVSDTRTAETDTSGDTLVERLTEAGHILADRRIVRDEISAIAARLRAWIADPDVEVVISTGGTGVTGRAVTPEAFASVWEKESAGFGEQIGRAHV